MARLSTGVIVRHPETGNPVALAAGTDLPRWANGLVGEHALEAEVRRAAKKVDVEAKKAEAEIEKAADAESE